MCFKRTIITVCIFFTAATLQAQRFNYFFNTVGERNGLSSNTCFTILKDSRGIMWVGTINGLNRYDGYHFYPFHARQDSNSFIHNTIFDLCEDKNGNIWGATGSGIFCYEVKQNRFRNYIPPGQDYARGILNIICDKKGEIWASGTWTILKLNKEKNSFDEIGPLTKNKDSLNAYAVRQNGMEVDPSGKGIWMATRMGLHFYNTSENRFYSYKNKPGDSVFAMHSVAALSLSQHGYFWFFDNTTKEIKAFDPVNHKILQRINTQQIIPDAIGQTLYEDSNHQLWFCTWNLKMAVLDYRNNRSTPLVNRPDNPLSFPGDNFWAVWEDTDNTVWLGTTGGLTRCNYTKSIYSIYPVAEQVEEFKDKSLAVITTDPEDNSWWIAPETDPVVLHYYPETGAYHFFDLAKASKNKFGLTAAGISGISFLDKNPCISTKNGIWVIDKSSKKTMPFTKTFKGLPGINPYYFSQAGDVLWFSTLQGLIKWNRVTDEVKLIAANGTTTQDGQTITYGRTVTDSKGRPWFIPAFGWLAHVTEKDEIEMVYYVKDKPKELSSFISGFLHFDSKDNLWMTSLSAGIYKYSTTTSEMKLLDQVKGVGTMPGTLTIDDKDRLWLGDKNKFSVYDPATGNISSFRLPLAENTVGFENNLVQDKDGFIIATVRKDVVKFSPGMLNLKPAVAVPLISSIKIAGQEKLINDEVSLTLRPSENSLEFSFGSLINNEVFPYTLEYKLDGIDKEWKDGGASAKAIYNNLGSGHYVFHVRASSKNKLWETAERKISITIQTPFYKARWFWLLITGLMIAALVAFYRFRLHKQKQILTLATKAQQLEKEKVMVMYEGLKQQLNPHFLFNSLTSLSGLIETNQQMAGKFLEQMSDMYRYILKNGDLETVLLKDELKFAQLYINLQKTRFGKGLLVNINVPEEFHHYKIAPVTLQNMMENAIKHNVIDPGSPLVIDIFTDEQENLIIRNNLQKKTNVETSNKKGLLQFITLYSYLSSRPVTISESGGFYSIIIPLV